MTHSQDHPKKQILIMEDHPLFRAMLVQLITGDLGMTVCGEADNNYDALKLTREKHPNAVIVDLTLRGPGGLELIKELKVQHPRLPVLVLSMHAESHYAERVLNAGARGVVPKEASPAEVAEAIRTVLAGRIYVSQRVNGMLLEKLAHGKNAPKAEGEDLLSDRELEVFEHLGHGLNSREIAARIKLEPTTVDSYRARIKEKLGIRSAAELYQRAAQWLAESGH